MHPDISEDLDFILTKSKLEKHWRFGPSDSSERAHVTDMAKTLPKNVLLVADAGFIGSFDFFTYFETGENHKNIELGVDFLIFAQRYQVKNILHSVF